MNSNESILFVMKKLLLLPIFALLFAPFINTANAQSDSDDIITNTIGIGPRLGYYKADDADEGNAFGGVQLRARFNRVIGIEAAVEYRGGQEYGISDIQTVETSFVPVTASALLFLPVDEHFQPYGVAGLGAYYTIYDTEGFDDDIDNEFNVGYHLGFGLEIPFNNKVALNADYRYLFLNPDRNEQNLEDTKFSGNAFTVGLMFYM